LYIQITDRCNMACPHCCFDCKPEGTDMNYANFKAAVDLSGEFICIGGGEPTLHPRFWEFVAYALAHGDVWMATNGSQTETALMLAKMARKGILGCDLSQDNFHRQIEPEVVKAFNEGRSWQNRSENNDRRGLRDVTSHSTRKPYRSGRAKELSIDETKEGCCCDEFIAKPNGDIMQCGCDDSPKIGTLFFAGEGDLPWELEGKCCRNEESSDKPFSVNLHDVTKAMEVLSDVGA